MNYALISRIIASLPDKHRQPCAKAFADAFASLFPRFKPALFMKACGIEDET